MNLKRLTDKAKGVVDKRGGTESLKGDAAELRKIADGPGSLKEKAKAAAEAIKKPGAEQTPEAEAGERAAEAEREAGEAPKA